MWTIIAFFSRSTSEGLVLLGFGVVLLVGAIAGVASVLIFLRLSLLAPSLIIEGRGAVSAIRRSWMLTKGNVGKILGVFLIAYLLVMVISGILEGPTQAIMLLDRSKGASVPQVVTVLNALVATVVDTVLVPITSIVAILLYYDIRIRREGFDLEMLAGELDAKRVPEQRVTSDE